MHFGISEGKGGLKHGSRPWLGMDIFWNCPMERTVSNNLTCKFSGLYLLRGNFYGH